MTDSKATASRRTVLAAAGLAGAAAAVAAAAGTPAEARSADGSRHRRPTIVLVHGAWADAGSWSGVIIRLERLGHTVRAVPNLLQGPRADAASVRAFLDSVDGPIVLVAHSYGGNVITDAAAGHPRVRALVLVAGFLPAEGESLGGLASRPVREPLPAAPVVAVPIVRADGTVSSDLYLDPARFREVFAADVSAERAAVLAATQRPAAAEVLTQTTVAAAWRTIPSWYLLTRDDLSLSPETQRFMADRAGATTVEVDASHAVAVSRPDAVVRLITDAVTTTLGR